ncbi:MAG TPA: response regulator transcription factor [Mycobacteriales bacterium]|nr:response regulator transcription factor [Mycobacteriales bacterium]
MEIPEPRAQRGLRVACVDDHVLFAQALAQALEYTAEYDVVFTGMSSTTISGVVDDIIQSRPEAVILDLQLGPLNGFDVLSLLGDAAPELPVLILTGIDDDDVVTHALELGAAGVISKAATLSEVVSGIRAVLAGRRVLPRRAAGAGGSGARFDSQRHLCSYLTPREREVLSRLAAGHATSRIARDLSITVHTTRSHIQNLLTKLGVHTKLQAVALAVNSGMIEPYREPATRGEHRSQA